MKPFFTADDFHLTQTASEMAARYANKKLEREGVVVYGDPDDLWSKVLNDSGSKDTHRAILINIEEIEKKPCEHEPRGYSINVGGPMRDKYYRCEKCGVKLKAIWEEVK